MCVYVSGYNCGTHHRTVAIIVHHILQTVVFPRTVFKSGDDYCDFEIERVV